jgi:hypothetical protein
MATLSEERDRSPCNRVKAAGVTHGTRGRENIKYGRIISGANVHRPASSSRTVEVREKVTSIWRAAAQRERAPGVTARSCTCEVNGAASVCRRAAGGT